MFERLADRFFRDFVEHEPLDGHFRTEDFTKVPTDRLPFAVFVSRQIEGLGVLERLPQLGDLLRLVLGNDIDRRKIVIDVDPEIGPGLVFVLLRNLLGTLGKVPNVADTGLHLELGSKKFADGSGLGRRFDNHQRPALFCTLGGFFCHARVLSEGILESPGVRSIPAHLGLPRLRGPLQWSLSGARDDPVTFTSAVRSLSRQLL